MALEGRLTFSEQRLAALERGGKITPKWSKRELTPEEKKAVRERLVAGQENARLKRETEAKKEK